MCIRDSNYITATVTVPFVTGNWVSRVVMSPAVLFIALRLLSIVVGGCTARLLLPYTLSGRITDFYCARSGLVSLSVSVRLCHTHTHTPTQSSHHNSFISPNQLSFVIYSS